MMPMHQFEQSGEICCNCQLSVRRQDLLYFLREDLAEAPASTLKMALRHQAREAVRRLHRYAREDATLIGWRPWLLGWRLLLCATSKMLVDQVMNHLNAEDPGQFGHWVTRRTRVTLLTCI